MCAAEKCCYFLPLGVAGYFIGIADLLESLAISVGSITLLLREDSEMLIGQAGNTTMYNDHIFSVFILNKDRFDFVMWTLLIISQLHIIFTIFYIIGLIKNKPDLVLIYYGLAIMRTILIQIVSLLELIHNYWISAIVVFLISAFKIHLLIIVHSIYEGMLTGSRYTCENDENYGSDDDVPILEEFDDINT